MSDDAEHRFCEYSGCGMERTCFHYCHEHHKLICKEDDSELSRLRSQLAVSEKALAEAKGLLKKLEWHDYDETESGLRAVSYCPVCRSHFSEGHDEDCELSAAIKEPK